MADFTMLEGGGGGGHHTPSHSSKKGTIAGLPKPVFFIGAAILMMALLYLRSVSRGSTNNSTGINTNVNPSQVDYPTNSTDVASQLQNNSDILTGQVTASLNQFQAQMQSDYGTQLTQLADKMNALQGEVSTLNAHPNPASTASSHTSPVPKSEPVHTSAPVHRDTPKVSQGPNYLSGVGRKHYATPRGGFHTSTSVVDFLKSKGYDASYNSRKRIASNLGIHNYSGTASQNETMLSHLKGI